MIWQKGNGLRYKAKMIWQRFTRGFSDYEVYTFQKHFAGWMLPRLKRTLDRKKEIGFDIPTDKWERMIKGFELILDEDSWDAAHRAGTEEHEAIRDALRLFEKLFWQLSY